MIDIEKVITPYLSKPFCKFFLPSLPPSVNATYKSKKNGIYKDQSVLNWQRTNAWDLLAQSKKQGINVIDYQVAVIVSLHVSNKKKQDLDNRLKSLFDTFEMSGVLKNDALIINILSHFDFNDKKDAVSIHIFNV